MEVFLAAMDTTKAAARPPLRVLTALRFAAAAEVVIGHYFRFDQTDFLHNLFSAGRQAVTFFFVLSGFILTYVYSDPARPSRINVDNRDFWKARGARILPVYWFGLLISAPLLIYGTFVSRISPVDRTIEGLILTPVLLQAWAPPVAETWNPPGWSLSVEALFYAVFPWVARLAFRIRIRWLFAAALVSAIAADLVAQAMTQRPAPTGDAYLFAWHFPLLSLPQFLFGVAAARFYLSRGPLPQRQSVWLFAAASAAVVLVVGAAPWLGLASGSATLAPLFAAMILGGAGAGGSRAMRPLTTAPAMLLGEASYGLYILHMPLLFWWTWTGDRLGAALPRAADFLLYFAFVTACSIVTYLALEKPLRRRILGRREHRPA